MIKQGKGIAELVTAKIGSNPEDLKSVCKRLIPDIADMDNLKDFLQGIGVYTIEQLYERFGNNTEKGTYEHL